MKVFGFVLLLALTACTTQGTGSEAAVAHAEKVETIDEILTEPLASEEYVDEVRCLSTHNYRNVEVLDDQHVLFHGSGDRLWLNQLRQRCLGLRPHDTLRFELRNNRLCDMDSFQGVDQMFWMWQRTTGTCILGTFSPITEEQEELVRTAISEAKD